MTDVLVIGGGPAGSAAGYWLATHGHSVTIVEKRQFPRNKTCGDALSPRAVRLLGDMGLGPALGAYHRVDGVRFSGRGRAVELRWPAHPDVPPYGYVARRRDLDQLVANAAAAAGATLLQGHEALRPLVERGFVRGATVQTVDGATVDLHARYVVIADGANSRFGRSLGTFRTRDWPYGTAIRSYWASPRHDEPFLESVIDLHDRSGNSLPGYGWVFPVGDGTVNVGVGLLSTFRDFKNVNTSHLLESFTQDIAERWQLDPEHPTLKPAAGRIPMGGSVGPKAGPTYLVVGDAAGSVSPFNGDGLDGAYATGRIAAEVLHEALIANDATVLQQYASRLEREYGQYFKVGRLFAAAIGRPGVMRELTRVGLHSNTLMEWMLRIMTNTLRPNETGPAELAYKAAANIVRLAPNA